MKILALELSSAEGSLALLDDEKLEFHREWPNDRKNSGQFFKHLIGVQEQFGRPDTIVVGLGPGSYAGTRIAISSAIDLRDGMRRVGILRDRRRAASDIFLGARSGEQPDRRSNPDERS